jgi:hypothetical protein
LWALLVLVAALIGGLAAAELVHVSLVIAVPISVAAAGIAVLAAARWPGRPTDPQLPGSRPLESRPLERRLAETQPGPARPSSDGLSPAETVVQLLPVSPETPWWDAAQAAQGGPPAPGSQAQRVPAPDLSTYLASTIIAQCPNCGAFRLDFRRAGNGWDFRCESCGYTWTWQPGTAWPPVRVAPRRRKE